MGDGEEGRECWGRGSREVEIVAGRGGPGMVGEAVWCRGSMDGEVGEAESKGEMRIKDGRGRILGLVRGGGWK